MIHSYSTAICLQVKGVLKNKLLQALKEGEMYIVCVMTLPVAVRYCTFMITTPIGHIITLTCFGLTSVCSPGGLCKDWWPYRTPGCGCRPEKSLPGERKEQFCLLVFVCFICSFIHFFIPHSFLLLFILSFLN